MFDSAKPTLELKTKNKIIIIFAFNRDCNVYYYKVSSSFYNMVSAANSIALARKLIL